MSDQAQGKKKRGMLTSFSIIFILLAIVCVITVIVSGITTEVTGASLSDFLMAPAQGFADAIDVCLFVMVLGGFLGIMNKTNALSDGIAVLVQKMGGKETRLIPILMALFAFCGSTYGMCEETVGFYALLSATMMAAGFDTLTGAMIVLLGAGVGCLGSTVNPFATGIASSALTDMGIAVDQGVVIGLGAALLVAAYLVAVFFVLQYAKRVKADPNRTLLSAAEIKHSQEAYGEASAAVHEEKKLTGRQKACLGIFAAAFIVMVISFIPWEDLGVNAFVAGQQFEDVTTEVSADDIIGKYADDGDLTLDPETVTGTLVSSEETAPAWSEFLTGTPLGQWYFAESTTWFLLLAIIIGIVGGLSEREIVDEFMLGAGDMMSVVMIIALSRGVSVVMSATGLYDYFLNSAAAALAGTSGPVFAIGSFLLYFVLSFLIPSTSGMATVSMPIMGPLALKLGFNPAVMVMIFSAASGVVNLITPTSGAIMGGLALSRVEYSTWVKFALKVVAVMSVVCVIILTVAMLAL